MVLKHIFCEHENHGRESVKVASLFVCIEMLFEIFSYPCSAETGKQQTDSTKTPYPRIAMLWSAVRGDDSVSSIARHDLIMTGFGKLGLKLDGQPPGIADGFTSESVKVAMKKIAEIKRHNPDAVILADVPFYEYPDNWLPENHPWWLKKNGERVKFWPGTHRMNWYDAEYLRHVVRQTEALKKVGIDGVFYDNMRNEREVWIVFLTEVRGVVGDEFLILANAGYAVGTYDFAAPYLNGIMYESGWSHKRTEWDDCMKKMQHTQTLLRKPTISVIERFEDIRDGAGWPNDPNKGRKPKADPAARRWSLCYALIIGDFYYLFSDNTSHRHNWYPEYHTKIGLPLGPSEQLRPYIWQRHYEKAIVIVNLPGAKGAHEVNLDISARDAFTGLEGTVFTVPPGDGRILVLK